MRILLLALALVLAACDSASLYEERGDIIVDTRTGLTYDRREATVEREKYRDMLEEQGQTIPGVPLVLSQKQREELADWTTAGREAKKVELEVWGYTVMLEDQGREVPVGLEVLSRKQREEVTAWDDLFPEAMDLCLGASIFDITLCAHRKRKELWEASLELIE